jgi:hypothetical protein
LPKPRLCEGRSCLSATDPRRAVDIASYTSAGRDAFFAERMRQDATIRKLQVKGQAVKNRNRRRRADALLVLAASISTACSDRTLTPDCVATLIGELDAFKRDARLTIRTGLPFQSGVECQSQADVANVATNRREATLPRDGADGGGSSCLGAVDAGTRW